METRPMFFNLDNFNDWLRKSMLDRNISVKHLSKTSGVHPNTIRNYLACRCEPSYYNVVLLVNALGYEMVAVPK